jgi:hypothetical protein
MNITLIASDNGLGHIKRVIEFSNILIKKNKIRLLIPKKFFSKFKINKLIKVIDFEMRLNVKNKSYNYNWTKRLDKKHINNSDLIICDNLPEIIKFNKKTIIVANFFWHHILPIQHKKKIFLDKLLRTKNIPIFGNYLFVNNLIKKKFNTAKIGFIGNFQGKKRRNIKNILIALGTSKIDHKQQNIINKQITKMIENINTEKFNIYLDPLVKLEKKFKKKLFKADFSNSMYNWIDVAIIKPGLGTITECLERAIPIICYTKNLNNEFKYNVSVLKNKNLGITISDFNQVPKLIKEVINNKQFLKNFFFKCEQLKWCGDMKLQKEIEKNFK